ncbi:MAG: hypothetical protein EOP09_17140 [Proteobacteria bacterium]|nr:MAG: hypothetical protein EOP09_17140 [Pseudomonadota bacterium]
MNTATMQDPTPLSANKTISETNSISRLLLIGGIALVIPVALYLLSRLMGSLPSARSWVEQGTLQGPWRGSWQGLTLYLPFVAALLSLAIGARHLSRQHYTRSIRCLGLAVAQGAAALALYVLIGWTVN